MDAKKRVELRRRRLAQSRGVITAVKLRTMFTVFALCATMGIAGILGVDIFADKATAANEKVNISVTVETGDSLWSIATDHIEKGKNIRSYVYEIADLNDIEDNTIYAGQTILVPVIRS